jgi:hypothetical protein
MRFKLSILLVCLAGMFYLAVGTYKASHFSPDLIPVYSGASCFVHGCDPYNAASLQARFLEAHGNPQRLTPDFWVVRPPVYPPSTLLILSPLVLLPFPAASVVWALLGGTLFLFAVGLVLWVCPRKYFEVGAVLAAVFLLADSPALLGTGNPATFACSLTVIGAVFFLRDRYIPLAVVLLTIGLTTKPQVAGFILLYFVARKIHWRGALIAMGASLAMLLIACGVLQTRPASRNWLPTLRAGITESIQPGHTDDPTPANVEFTDLVNLQTLTSTFIEGRTAYNVAAWVMWLAMFAAWVIAVKRTGAGGADHLLALPALLVLSLLPVYHRGCDDLLLLLAIPLVVKVTGRRRALGLIIAGATTLPHLMDVVMPRLSGVLGRQWTLASALQHRLSFLLLMRYQCPVLLLLFGLYVAAMYAGQGGQEAAEPMLASHAYSA